MYTFVEVWEYIKDPEIEKFIKGAPAYLAMAVRSNIKLKKKFSYNGKVVSWGVESDGDGPTTVAVVINDNGSVALVPVELLKMVGSFYET